MTREEAKFPASLAFCRCDQCEFLGKPPASQPQRSWPLQRQSLRRVRNPPCAMHRIFGKSRSKGLLSSGYSQGDPGARSRPQRRGSHNAKVPKVGQRGAAALFAAESLLKDCATGRSRVRPQRRVAWRNCFVKDPPTKKNREFRPCGAWPPRARPGGALLLAALLFRRDGPQLEGRSMRPL